MFSCSFCAGMCVPMCAGRFLDIPESLLPRGAASGGKRWSRGAAKSMSSLQAASSRAQAPPSGRSRARSTGRWASPRADRRSCAPRCARACAGEAAARRGWAPLWWDAFCACAERLGTPVWSPYSEVSSRDVFVSLHDFYYECYNMCNTSCKEFSHTTIISQTRSHLSGTDSAARGLQACAAAEVEAALVQAQDEACWAFGHVRNRVRPSRASAERREAGRS